MIREAIDRVIQSAKEAIVPPDIKDFHGLPHQSVKSEAYKPILPHLRSASISLSVTTLQAVLDFLATCGVDGLDPKNLRVVVSSRSVNVWGPMRSDGSREHLISASPTISDLVGEKLGRQQEQQDAIIWLQTNFYNNEDRAYLLRLIGNLAAENVRTLSDDGVHQEAVVKTGTVRTGAEVVKNEVVLLPRRSFPEVTLNGERFLVRLRGGSDKEMPTIALYDVEGDAWKLDAVAKIKAFFDQRVPPKDRAWSLLA